MRKLKLQIQMTVDGFIAGPNGEMDWVTWNWDDELKKYITKITDPVDTIILGRKLAQGFIPHWASVPEAEGADKMNNTPKVVFTKTLEKSEWDNTVLAKGDIVTEVNKLKNQGGGDIIAYGGANFVSNLIEHNLIDELHLFINPASLGSGMRIFPGKINLRLTEARAFDCGISLLKYEVSK